MYMQSSLRSSTNQSWNGLQWTHRRHPQIKVSSKYKNESQLHTLLTNIATDPKGHNFHYINRYLHTSSWWILTYKFSLTLPALSGHPLKRLGTMVNIIHPHYMTKCPGSTIWQSLQVAHPYNYCTHSSPVSLVDTSSLLVPLPPLPSIPFSAASGLLL